jgi:hypothetical protein
MKICIYCKETKQFDQFPKHSHSRDNLDNRCKECVKQQTVVRKKLYQDAPPKPKVCECCGKEPSKWCLDHDHTDDSFRGWLCDKCNTGIGNLGDNLDGLIKAVNYLISKSF